MVGNVDGLHPNRWNCALIEIFSYGGWRKSNPWSQSLFNWWKIRKHRMGVLTVTWKLYRIVPHGQEIRIIEWKLIPLRYRAELMAWEEETIYTTPRYKDSLIRCWWCHDYIPRIRRFNVIFEFVHSSLMPDGIIGIFCKLRSLKAVANEMLPPTANAFCRPWHVLAFGTPNLLSTHWVLKYTALSDEARI